MNERIKLLYNQAARYAFNQRVIDQSFAADLHLLINENFAELIVKECMTTVLKESKWYWDKDEFESSNAIQNAARRLKEHFGVEE